jgi:4-amino-4-deoxy-L-arabinose transferase-like glycosyltransferase
LKRSNASFTRKASPLWLIQHAVLPLGFFAWLLTTVSRFQAVGHDADEGVNLMKALLVTKGFRLYRAIWSDQPPIFTYVLALQFKLFGGTTESGRTLVIALAALLLWSLYQAVRQLHGVAAAIAAVTFVVASHRFIELSSAVMIGLPAIALGMVAVWMAVQSRRAASFRCGRIWLVASALFMGLSVQTKFFTLTLIPGVLALIIISIRQDKLPLNFTATGSRAKKLASAGIWLAAIAVVIGMIALLTSENWQQLLTPHLREEGLVKSRFGFADLFLDAIDGGPYLVPLALLGVGVNVYRRRRGWVVPATWLATAGIVLMVHQPLRTHYVPLIGIPICWMAALGVEATVWGAGECLRGLKPTESEDKSGSGKRIAAQAVILVAMAGAFAPILWQCVSRIEYEKSQLAEASDSSAEDQRAIVEHLKSYQDRTRWIFSDLLIYPFAARLAAPPELAIITEKRIATGFLSDQYLVEQLTRYRPEQILIGRFSYGTDVMDYITKNYRVVWQAPAGPTQYLRKDIGA